MKNLLSFLLYMDFPHSCLTLFGCTSLPLKYYVRLSVTLKLKAWGYRQSFLIKFVYCGMLVNFILLTAYSQHIFSHNNLATKPSQILQH